MERLIQDIRFAARLLWRDRGFASAAILTLALCIGANGAIFAVINSVLLRPLAVPEPERLVVIYNSYPRAGVLRASNAVPDYYDRLRETDVFEELAPYNTRGVTIGIDGQPQRVLSMVARPSLLRMLRVQPVRGRIFTEDDGEIGREQKVVLTYSAWHQLFGAQESAIGSQLRINGVPHEVVGVLPAGFQFLSPDVRFWTPLAFSADDRSDNERHSNDWSMVGRLRPGATIAVAGQQIDALNARNLERFPDLREILTNAGFHTVVKPLQQDLVENVRGTLLLLWGGVVVVLLIGGVNITNLVLIRSTARLRELATRHALGAGIGRLTRQLLTETILLTIAGGVVGLAVGHYGLGLLSTVGIDRLPRGGEVRMDAAAVAFTLGLACAAGIVLGLVPAVNVRRMNLSQAFREDGRSGTTGRGTRAVRRLLVASQVAFAFMLLAGAGVLVASFDRVLAIDPGFEPHGVLTARISAPASRYPQNSDLRSFGDRVLESMRAVPGVQQAALASNVPFGGDYTDGVILAEGYQMAAGESVVSPYRVAVSPGYFDALGIGLKAGRTFTASDTAESQPVVIVDERLARRFWLGANPVGRRMYRPGGAEDVVKPGPNARWLTVVGVVEEVRIAGLVTANDRGGAYYLPETQDMRRNVWLVTKSAIEPGALTSVLRSRLTAIDAELPLFNVRTMEDRIGESLIDRRTPMILATLFAVAALLLAVLGIYGVLAYQVTQRQREIGIRMALGSDARRVFSLVLGEGLTLMAVGLSAGLAGAFSVRRVLEAQLYEIGAMDPFVLTSVAAVVALMVVIACSVPARRAARIDPLAALSDQ